MDAIGYWTLGLFIFAISFTILEVASRPLLDYHGDSAAVDTIIEWFECLLETIGSGLFLSLPIAFVYGFYALGKAAWGLIT